MTDGAMTVAVGAAGTARKAWSNARLDRPRKRGDPAGDAVAAAWFAEQSHLTPGAAVGRLARHDALAPEDQSPTVTEYLAARPPLPDWVDAAKVRAGQQFFEQWGPQIWVALFVASLPCGY